MNSIKTLLMAAVLAAGAYGVYYAINHRGSDNAATNTATSEAPGWPGTGSNGPTMQIPGPGGSQSALGTTGATATLPPVGGTNSYSPQASSPRASGAGTGNQVPPFVSPGTALPQPGTLPPTAPGTPAKASELPFPKPEPGSPGSDGSQAGASSQTALADAGLSATGSAGQGMGLDAPGAGSPAAIDPQVTARFNAFMEAVQSRLDQGRLAEAHLALSTLYDNPDLPEPLSRQVISLLDQLAGTVIYSRGHYLEPAYLVRPGDTLEQIARDYQVPALLLARINGISDPEQLRPGQELKVVRGPFNAVIHLERFELTLMLNGRYAGRFPIGIGGDAPELVGAYTVQAKVVDPSYCGRDGVNFEAGDPRNPLGKFLIDLGEGVALHGTNDPGKVGRISERGVICLTPRDIDDLFGILSIGSQVVIER